ncbi:uncharacterized protein LOC134223507 [Armigeres subalbatus]|uniref:uncharacterized protein LOC134223507 n=1 Tax=Armigeres subalbatus TaxID=124917 RepID=UPI002ED63CF4
MVLKCTVPSCGVYSSDQTHQMFRLPSVGKRISEQQKYLAEHRLALWVEACGLKKSPASHHRVCSRHFFSGKPAKPWEKDEVDWIPTRNLSESDMDFSNVSAELREEAENDLSGHSENLGANQSSAVSNTLMNHEDSVNESNIDSEHQASEAVDIHANQLDNSNGSLFILNVLSPLMPASQELSFKSTDCDWVQGQHELPVINSENESGSMNQSTSLELSNDESYANQSQSIIATVISATSYVY